MAPPKAPIIPTIVESIVMKSIRRGIFCILYISRVDSLSSMPISTLRSNYSYKLLNADVLPSLMISFTATWYPVSPFYPGSSVINIVVVVLIGKYEAIGPRRTSLSGAFIRESTKLVSPVKELNEVI